MQRNAACGACECASVGTASAAYRKRERSQHARLIVCEAGDRLKNVNEERTPEVVHTQTRTHPETLFDDVGTRECSLAIRLLFFLNWEKVGNQCAKRLTNARFFVADGIRVFVAALSSPPSIITHN